MAESIDTRGTFHQVEPFEDSGAETSVAILEQLEWEEEQRRQKERGRCRCHWKYPCTIPGIVKIVEMILDMIAFLCVACSDWYADFHSTYRFFEFVSMTTFWITLTLMVLYITLTIFMCPINWSLFEFIYCCIAVILYIFASCFLAARAYNIGGLAAGTVFGFFAAIAYAVGALVSWWECRHPEWDLRGLGEEDSWLRGGTPWWPRRSRPSVTQESSSPRNSTPRLYLNTVAARTHPGAPRKFSPSPRVWTPRTACNRCPNRTTSTRPLGSTLHLRPLAEFVQTCRAPTFIYKYCTRM
ncbi:uncharacterized protein LOC144908389 [Branchiostoma floridae x Branchiostoma belcheri]